ncbi:MAG: hypothetical protein ASARMPREDX12_005504 [Alectoria sarmentosa]|nr:MAG: hypothetical protein ASARMPREDX12_005504 [Alectoria sarmentosa]
MLSNTLLYLSLVVTSVPSISANPVGAPLDVRAPTVSKGPTTTVTCPVPDKADITHNFTVDYVSKNIIDIINHGKKKGSYPKEWKSKSDKADQFTWLNDCTSRAKDGEKLLELPMWVNSAGTAVNWSANPASNNNKPGPFREYYILKNETATYCGAYTHADTKSNDELLDRLAHLEMGD